jgi:[acyl-carrier-protein] S-malonyltransferase
MQEASLASPSGMVSVVGDVDAVEALCEKAAEGDVLVPANFNCPGQVAISGSKEACQRAVKVAGDFGARAIPLKVAGAFHSPFMAPAGQKLGEALDQTPLTRPRVPVVANVSADYHGEADSIRAALQQQVTKPVLWTKSIQRLINDGYDTFVEVGPGRVLTGLMRKIDRSVRALSVGRVDGIDAALAETAAK